MMLEVMLWLSALVAVALVLLVPLVIIKQSQLSRARYALWRIRDEVVDGIARDALPNKKAFVSLVEAIEGAIVMLPDISIAPVMWLHWRLSPESRARVKQDRKSQLVELTGTEEDSLVRYEYQFSEILTEFWLRSSIYGWILSLVGVGKHLRMSTRRPPHERPPNSELGETSVVRVGLGQVSMSEIGLVLRPHEGRDLAAFV